MHLIHFVAALDRKATYRQFFSCDSLVIDGESADVIGMTLGGLSSAEDSARLRQAFSECQLTGQPQYCEVSYPELGTLRCCFISLMWDESKAVAPDDLVAIMIGEQLPMKHDLSKQETEVARLIAEDLHTDQIAEELGLSSSTVETYRTRIHKKLGTHGTAGIVRFAIRSGLVDG